MAKQASMDLLTIGRISQGNMDSIVMMPIADQEETIKTALTYTATLNKAISAVDDKVKLEMQQKTAADFNYIEPPQPKSLLTVNSEDI
jgi:hypothetical protein